MEHYREKLAYLKWLKLAGVNFYVNSNECTNKITIDLQKFGNTSLSHDHIYIANQQNEPDKISNFVKEKSQNYQIKPVTTLMPDKKTDRVRTLKNINTLEELRKELDNFEECELKYFAKNTVFGDGISDADILIIGEAPGASEDEQGIPFCGQSGQLLDKMLESIGLSRKENIYITNTIFWRPPANRRPTNEEIELCRPFVQKHIALVKPKLIILVGATAATSLLGKHDGISKIRQNHYTYTNDFMNEEIKMMAIFHPAYLLRQPMQKKAMWYDLLKIQDFINQNQII